MRDRDAAESRFPIFWASFGSVGLAIRSLTTYIRAGWLSIILFLVSWVAFAYLQMTGALLAVPENQGQLETQFALGLIGIVMIVAPLVLLVPAITAWIRLTVLGHPENGGFPTWEFRRREWVCLGYYVVLLILGILILVAPIILATIVADDSFLVLGILVLFGFVGALYTVARLLPLLAAAAIGEPTSIKETWRLTRSCGGRVTVAFVIVHACTTALLIAVLILLEVFGLGAFVAEIDGLEMVRLFESQSVGTDETALLFLANLIYGSAYGMYCLVFAVFYGRVHVEVSVDAGGNVARAFD